MLHNACIFTLAATLLFTFPTLSSAHLSTELLYCPVFAEVGATHTPKFLKGTIIQNGLLGETYDVDNDGKPDIATYSSLEDYQTNDTAALHKDIPIFYEVNLDDDMVPDALYKG